MVKVLVTGASGFLAQDVIRELCDSGLSVFATYHHNSPYLNVLDNHDIYSCLRLYQPDYIVHLAAITDVDYCETHLDEAKDVNHLGTKQLASLAREMGARIIYTSTDFVFDGDRGNYTEKDIPVPKNVYGESKLRGERAVMEASDENIIFRLCMLYGPRGSKSRSFLVNGVDKLEKGDSINLFDDQFRSPLYTIDAAKAIVAAIKEKIPGGIYHLSGSKCGSIYQIGCGMYKHLGLSLDLISAIKTTGFRPHNVILNHKKAADVFGFSPVDFMVSIDEIFGAGYAGSSSDTTQE